MADTFDNLDWPNPVNRQHSLNRGLIGWWLGVPSLTGGVRWPNLMRPGVDCVLTGMDPKTDWVASRRAGGCRALDFDGTNDYVTLSNFSGFKPQLPVTIAAWVYQRDAQRNPVFCNDRTLNTWYGVTMHINSTGTVSAEFGNGTGLGGSNRRTKSGGSVPLDEWHHLAVAIRGATDMSIYMDGVDAGGSYSGTGGALAYNGTTDGAIGFRDYAAGTPAGEEYANALIDDVRFWGRSLSDTEIGEVYRESLAGYPELLCRQPLLIARVAQAAALRYSQLERGLRGFNRGLCTGMRG